MSFEVLNNVTLNIALSFYSKKKKSFKLKMIYNNEPES